MLIIASGATTSLYLMDAGTGTASTITLSSFLGPDGSIDPANALTAIAPDGLVREATWMNPFNPLCRIVPGTTISCDGV